MNVVGRGSPSGCVALAEHRIPGIVDPLNKPGLLGVTERRPIHSEAGAGALSSSQLTPSVRPGQTARLPPGRRSTSLR